MDILRVNKERRRSDSISDIISRFHKIREERARQSANSFQFQSTPTPRSEMRPSSAKGQLNLGTTDIVNKRRNSVPYVFRPLDPQVSPRQDPPLFRDYRRHSISHAVYEYELAKAQIKQKRVAQVKKVKKSPRKKEAEDEDCRKWLVGEDLHNFYSFWDRPKYVEHRKQLEKLRASRRAPLPLPFGINGDNKDTERRRLSSF